MNYLEVALQDGYSFVGTIVLIVVIGFMIGFCLTQLNEVISRDKR